MLTEIQGGEQLSFLNVNFGGYWWTDCVFCQLECDQNAWGLHSLVSVRMLAVNKQKKTKRFEGFFFL